MLFAGRTFSADALRGLRRPSHKTQYNSETVTLSIINSLIIIIKIGYERHQIVKHCFHEVLPYREWCQHELNIEAHQERFHPIVVCVQCIAKYRKTGLKIIQHELNISKRTRQDFTRLSYVCALYCKLLQNRAQNNSA